MGTPGLSRYVASRTVSIFGDRIAETALPIIILLATRDALLAGLVTAANVAPTLLFSLPIGQMVDKRERRGLMVLSDLWRFILATVLAVSLISPEPSAAILVTVAFLMGCGDVLFTVSAQAYLPALVPMTRIMRANTLLEAGDATATLSGPIAAGAVLTRFGPAVAIGLNALSFAASVLLLWRLPDSRPRGAAVVTSDSAAPDRGEVLAGIRLLISNPTQRLLQLGSAYMHLVAGSGELIIISYALQELNLNSAMTGVLLSAAGIGGLVVSLAVVRFVESAHWGPLLGLALLGIAAGALCMAVTTSFAVSFGAVLVMDASSALAFITAGSARQVFTPSDVLGRLTAATGIVNSALRAAGAISAGAVVLVVGSRGACVALGVFGLAAAVPLMVARTARARMNESSALVH